MLVTQNLLTLLSLLRILLSLLSLLRVRCPSIFSSIVIELSVPRDNFSSIAIELTFVILGYGFKKSKKISNDQELIQSDPISCPQNQKGNN